MNEAWRDQEALTKPGWWSSTCQRPEIKEPRGKSCLKWMQPRNNCCKKLWRLMGSCHQCCWYKALKLTQTKLTPGPKTPGCQDTQFVSERAQTTEQNHKAKKGLISSLLLLLVMLWKMETPPTQQCYRDGNTSTEWEGFSSQWSRITSNNITYYCHT